MPIMCAMGQSVLGWYNIYQGVAHPGINMTWLTNLGWKNLINISVFLKYDAQYHQVSNIRFTLVGNKIVDHSDVVGASPVGAAPTTSSFST